MLVSTFLNKPLQNTASRALAAVEEAATEMSVVGGEGLHTGGTGAQASAVLCPPPEARVTYFCIHLIWLPHDQKGLPAFLLAFPRS